LLARDLADVQFRDAVRKIIWEALKELGFIPGPAPPP